MSDSFKVKKSDVVARMVKLAIDDEFDELVNLSDSLSEYNEFYHTVTLSAFYQEELSHWVRTYGEPIRDEPAPDGDRLSGCTLNTDAAKAGAGFASWLHKTVQPVKFEVGETFFGVDRELKQTLSGTQTITSIDRAIVDTSDAYELKMKNHVWNHPNRSLPVPNSLSLSHKILFTKSTEYYVPVPSQAYCDMFNVSSATGRTELDNAWKHTDAGGMTFRLDASLLTSPVLKTWISGFDPDWMFAIPKPPDTEPGLGNNAPTTSNHTSKHSGCSCAECKAFNEYGEPNQPNGQYVCYACRENLAWKYR